MGLLAAAPERLSFRGRHALSLDEQAAIPEATRSLLSGVIVDEPARQPEPPVPDCGPPPSGVITDEPARQPESPVPDCGAPPSGVVADEPALQSGSPVASLIATSSEIPGTMEPTSHVDAAVNEPTPRLECPVDDAAPQALEVARLHNPNPDSDYVMTSDDTKKQDPGPGDGVLPDTDTAGQDSTGTVITDVQCF